MLIFVLTMFQDKPLNGTCTTTGRSTTTPVCAAIRLPFHHLRVLPLDLCPAAACTVQLLPDEE